METVPAFWEVCITSPNLLSDTLEMGLIARPHPPVPVLLADYPVWLLTSEVLIAHQTMPLDVWVPGVGDHQAKPVGPVSH